MSPLPHPRTTADPELAGSRGPATGPASEAALRQLRRALEAEGYRGELSTELAQRVVFSTDNSVYQVLPWCVATPAEVADIGRLLRANQRLPKPLALAARGGGTGTNGQSLTDSLLLDLSRLRAIRSIDAQGRRAWVEPGVILDQLNERLAEHDLFFAPHVSTASRATLGGMVATDAAGKGSRIYGRTHRHVTALRVVLAGGSEHIVRRTSLARNDSRSETGNEDSASQLDAIHRRLRHSLETRRQIIEQGWPRLERGLSGYNLLDALPGDGTFDPIALLCGSEGTLAMVSEIEVALLPRPACRALVIAAYDDFVTALDEAPDLLAWDPAAIEAMDEWVQSLGKQSTAWSAVADRLPSFEGSCLYIELLADDETALHKKVDGLLDALRQRPRVRGVSVATEPADQKLLWRLRKDAVGLLAKVQAGPGGRARPQAFVEDCAVPAERLAPFIAEFRQLLDDHGLTYGMYGHADAGCVHVRPALDLSGEDSGGVAVLRQLSDRVATLVKEYGGVLWGEHGRGFRGEYAAERLGPELHDLMCQVKAAFDPQGILNPGKLYGVAGQPVLRLDDVPLRAERDRTVTPEHRQPFEAAFGCNGNGICHHHGAREVMCPSFKATGDFRQSPKGRADMLREWTRQASLGAADPAFAEQLRRSLDGCLSCKACTTRCPAEVDIPELKSRFLDSYFRSRRRPLREHLLRGLEIFGPWLGRAPAVANALLDSPLSRLAAARLGLVDLPRWSSPGLPGRLKKHQDRLWTVDQILRLSAEERARSVVLLADPFTSLFAAQDLMATHELIAALGYRPRMVRLGRSGKYEHVKGFRRAFRAAAKRQIRRLAPLAGSGLPVVGIEPSIVLLWQQEYRQAGVAGLRLARVSLLQDWLLEVLEPVDDAPCGAAAGASPQLFLHCSERAAHPDAANAWRQVFRRLGGDVEVVASGCCGMAGVFGHEAENQPVSRRLFDLSWAGPLAGDRTSLATGFSCRGQAHRILGRRLAHPAAALLDLIHHRPQAGHQA